MNPRSVVMLDLLALLVFRACGH